MCLLELPAKSEILTVDLRELLRGRIDVLEVPLELIFKLHRADDDVHLDRRNGSQPTMLRLSRRPGQSRTLTKIRISSCMRFSSSSKSSTAINTSPPGATG